MNQADEDAPISNRGCAVLLAVWVLWALVMFVRVCYVSMTVDGANLPTAAFLALIFGFVTLEGIGLYHLPGILYFGGMIGYTIIDAKRPHASRRLKWLAVALGASAVVAFYILSIATADGCDPLTQLGCL